MALMHEMLAKQDILLQQQMQIFSLHSAPECSLDLPIRNHQGLETRLQDHDYMTKLVLTPSVETSPSTSTAKVDRKFGSDPLSSEESSDMCDMSAAVYKCLPQPGGLRSSASQSDPLSSEASTDLCDMSAAVYKCLLPSGGLRSSASQMDITIQIGDSLPEVTRCTDCCNDFHCPFCGPDHFQPTGLARVKVHLKTHFNRSVKHDEFTIHRCGRACRTDLHYHCLYCRGTVLRKEDFIKHLEGHNKHRLQPQRVSASTPSASMSPAASEGCSELLRLC